MAEEIFQRGLENGGIKVGTYEFYNIGATTLNDLKRYNIIPSKDYGNYGSRKPDGILIRRDKNNISVIAVIENKDYDKLSSPKQQKEAIEQCNTIAQILNCRIGIVTNGIINIWVNSAHYIKENEYFDKISNTYRSYSLIYNEDKKPLSEKFFIQNKSQEDIDKLSDDTKNTIDYIERSLKYIDKNKSILIADDFVDPLKLAKNVWQDIYVNTGKNPTSCLYNVVELFIFKFLSDLNVIEPSKSFYELIRRKENNENAQTILEYYAKICRPHIRNDLFQPDKDDGTTIINGTIFVDSKGDPVLSQASLFVKSIEKYNNFGNLKNIKKEFKTKLFETFLKQSHDKSRLGQFFTPRKVIKAIVNMVGFDELHENARICDPFCGVGGFVLEPLQISNIKKNFIPNNGEIKSNIKFFGFDKGFDEEEKRTIILAKANMLIYMSDIIERNPSLTSEYAKLFNETFTLLNKSNLGTLKLTFNEEEKFDLILTNPPYITSGSSSIKNLIDDEGLKNYYKCNGKGIESLCLEWIINNLKKNGKAFIIVPNSIFDVIGNKRLREYISENCIVNAIISLPKKTFFNTPQKTYILSLTKKMFADQKQANPVFMYLVDNIGETLDVNRFEIFGKSDLEKAVDLYNAFKGSPLTFPIESINDQRCKLIDIEEIVKNDNWLPESYWNNEEKETLGIIDREEILELEEITEKYDNFLASLTEDVSNLKKHKLNPDKKDFKTVCISDIFKIEKGKDKYTKQYIRNNPGDYPVYSSQTTNNGEIGHMNSYDYDEKCLTWTTDGVYAGTIFIRNNKFSMTTHCGALIPKDKNINVEYIYVQLRDKIKDYALGTDNKRVTVNQIKDIEVDIPIDKSGNYDYKRQEEISVKFLKVENLLNKINSEIGLLNNIKVKI